MKKRVNGANGAAPKTRTARIPAVTLIPGDGIGPEVIDAAVRVVAEAGIQIQWDRQIAGATALKAVGNPVPDALLKSLRRTGLALKGPLETRVGEGYRSINVYLRKSFNLYANLRPIQSLSGVATRFRDVDLVVVRENTEDLYAGLEHQLVPGVVESIKLITARASTRIARFAFEYARREKRHTVTAIHKANIMKLSDGLFLKCARQVARRYPEIKYQEQIVDAACMRLVTEPEAFDVLLLENLYGDIVSDLCAGLVGGLGLVPGANYGDKGAIFEAVHGTAPDIAGKGLANPTAAILSAAMLLDYIGETAAARRIRGATGAVLKSGRLLTRDLGGSATTAQLTEAIVATLRREGNHRGTARA